MEYIKSIRVVNRQYESEGVWSEAGRPRVDLKLSIYKSGIFGGKRTVKMESDSAIPEITEREKEYDYIGKTHDGIDGDDWHLVQFLVESIFSPDVIPSLEKYKKITFNNSIDIKTDVYTPVVDLDKYWVKRSAVTIPYLEIVENPYTFEFKDKRRYFGDVYYLNNGVNISIDWKYSEYIDYRDLTRISGEWFSDNWGRESFTYTDSNGHDYLKPAIQGQFSSINTFFTGIVKTVIIRPPDNSQIITINSKLNFVYGPDNSKIWTHIGFIPNGGGDFVESVPPEEWSDNAILNLIVSKWAPMYKNGVLKVVKVETKELDFINPVDYKPVDEVKIDNNTNPSDVSGVNTPTKINLNIVLPESLKVMAKQDLPDFYVYVGEPKPENNDELSNYDQLDPEYTDPLFQGMDEATMELIADTQIDVTQFESVIPSSVNITLGKYNSYDELVKSAALVAGKYFGKKDRINESNMKKNYIRGVHGLCPLGAKSFLAALTGNEKLATAFGGNAKEYGMKGGNDLTKSVNGIKYYNQKIQIKQKDGSWKGTYLNDSSKWQIGDIIANSYINPNDAGHIQIWTGYCWQSDFKQNRIQQPTIMDVNSVALWRMTPEGLKTINGGTTA